jgi:large conductance mechanosensitive channel
MLPENLRQPLQKTVRSGTSLWQEFKAFALKGNFIDLAIAVVIGTASTAVIKSLVQDVIMPALAMAGGPVEGGYTKWTVGPIHIGAFLGELVNFLVITLALFLVMVKLLGAIQKAALPAKADEPVTKECPLCLSVIPFKARKCAHCTADLTGP